MAASRQPVEAQHGMREHRPLDPSIGVSGNTDQRNDKGQPNTTTHRYPTPETISKIVRSFHRNAEIYKITATRESASKEKVPVRILVQERLKSRAKESSRASYNGNPPDVLGEAVLHIIHVEYLQKC